MFMIKRCIIMTQAIMSHHRLQAAVSPQTAFRAKQSPVHLHA